MIEATRIDTALRSEISAPPSPRPATIGAIATSAPLPMTTVSSGTSANIATLFSQPSNRPRVPSNNASTMNTGPMISSAASASRQTTSTPTVPSNRISPAIERIFAGEVIDGTAAAAAAGTPAGGGAGVIELAASVIALNTP